MKVGIARASAGIGLIHVMVYMSVVGLVLMVALLGFYRCQTQSIHLQRNTQDIGRALHAGELWRDEVRKSDEAELLEDGETIMLRLGSSRGDTFYHFGDEKVWRLTPGETNWTRLLQGVKSSEMLVEKRHGVEICRWELELVTSQKTVRLKPLFTFIAVPGT